MADLALLLLVFLGSTVVAYRLILQVPTKLHTPLMSMTNAISAVTILGALLVFAVATRPWEEIAGMLALLTASFNLVGGFVLTHRVLRMFKNPRGGARGQADNTDD